MGSKSKEKQVLKLILESSPLREWHFEELVRESGATRAIVNKWLKKYVKDGILKKKKQRGRFPYFVVGEKNTTYYSLKRTLALEKLHECGLFADILRSNNIHVAIIFGSFSRWDYYKDSDVDIFILGDVSDLNRTYYEKILERNIELHVFHNRKDLLSIKTNLLQNVINGYVLKGRIQDVVDVQI